MFGWLREAGNVWGSIFTSQNKVLLFGKALKLGNFTKNAVKLIKIWTIIEEIWEKVQSFKAFLDAKMGKNKKKIVQE